MRYCTSFGCPPNDVPRISRSVVVARFVDDDEGGSDCVVTVEVVAAVVQ